MKKNSVKVKYRLFLSFLLVLSFFLISILGIDYLQKQVPGKINLIKNQVKIIDFNLPLTGEIASNEVVTVNFSSPVSFFASDVGEYDLKVKLLGFNVKTVTIQVTEDQQLIPCGIPIGIYMNTSGVLVVNTGNIVNAEGISVCPGFGKIKSGDYITSINGKEIKSKSELTTLINEYGKEDIILGVRRNYENIEVRITPEADASGEYKIGAWIRDDSQGIGTLTYIDTNNNFGALGHGISDIDVGEILQVNSGILYQAKVLSIIKGKSGKPGEFIGSIDYNAKNQIGFIAKNTARGIFGTINNDKFIREYKLKALDIGFKEEVQSGKAYLRTYVEGKVKDYEIEISSINNNDNENGKNITFQVVDSNLLEITGGIVQGMSGSPIIQNNKIIGAVTHVFVDDATMGYGIFIENMLNQ